MLLKRHVRYGNGHENITFLCPEAKKQREEKNATLTEEKEKEINRNSASRRRFLEHATSVDYNYFCTFSVVDMELAHNGPELIKQVKKFIKETSPTAQVSGLLEAPRTRFDRGVSDKPSALWRNELNEENVNYLSAFEKKGFHLHVLSTEPFEIKKWSDEYGGDITHSYCEPIYTRTEKCVNYMYKSLKDTKALLPLGTRISFYINVKKKPLSKSLYLIDENGNEHIYYENSIATKERLLEEKRLQKISRIKRYIFKIMRIREYKASISIEKEEKTSTIFSLKDIYILTLCINNFYIVKIIPRGRSPPFFIQLNINIVFSTGDIYRLLFLLPLYFILID